MVTVMMRIVRRLRKAVGVPATPSWMRLGCAVVVFAAADLGSQLAGDSVVPGGPLDETAHFMTMLLVLWALGPRIAKRWLAPALIASVAIDVDHIPQTLGLDWLTVGTPRPYTHSLLTIGLLLLASLYWAKRRELLIGVALGIAIHFFRDLAEPGSGVALLWPWSYRSFSLPHPLYLAVMAAVVAVAGWRCAQVRHATARRELSAAPAHGAGPSA